MNCSYFCVKCKFDGCEGDRHIPLVEFRPEFYVHLPSEPFLATHQAGCGLAFTYEYMDVYRQDLERIPNFAAHPAFLETCRT